MINELNTKYGSSILFSTNFVIQQEREKKICSRSTKWPEEHMLREILHAQIIVFSPQKPNEWMTKSQFNRE